MPLTRRHAAAAILSLSALPGLAFAHRESATRTLITWNSATGFLEVTHTYHMHDAAMALTQAGVIGKPDLPSLRERARLALYTEAHFTLETLDSQALALTLLGADYDSKNAYVYQQSKLPAAPDGLRVDSRLLLDIVPGQANDVDVRLGSGVRSARFQRGDKPKIILA